MGPGERSSGPFFWLGDWLLLAFARIKPEQKVVDVAYATNGRSVVSSGPQRDHEGTEFPRPLFNAFPGGTPACANWSLFAALKLGGTLVVYHSAAPGSCSTMTDKLHQIDLQSVIDELTSAGFKLAASSDLSARPADPQTTNVFDPAIRGQTDQFTLQFRKPN